MSHIRLSTSGKNYFYKGGEDALAHKIKHIKKRAFLAAFAENGNVSLSATIAGIDRQTHYEWKRSDPDYAEAFTDAEGQAADRLEQEARRRAVDGVDEPVFYKGDEVGTIRKYSDTLLIFLMKGADPEKYKDRVSNEHSGKIAADVNHSYDLSKLSAEELIVFEQIITKAAPESG